MKTVWQKPKLIVLYKAQPDENLLQSVACKGGLAHKNRPDNATATICAWDNGERIGRACYTHTTS